MLLIKSALRNILLITTGLLAGTAATAQCGSIDFSADKTSVCAPDVVNFVATNIPAGSSIVWNYDGSDIPGNDSLQALFTNAGSYTVSLKVTLSDGSTCAVDKPGYITVYSSPKPDISVSRSVLCNGVDTITLTDKTPNVSSRTWIMEGNPLADTSAIVIYKFKSTGYKDVVISLKSGICPLTFYKLDSAVSVYDSLTFNITASDSTGCIPRQIQFNATINTPGHTISSYQWSFPGGTPSVSSAASPSVAYNAAGTFNVSLTLTNTQGCTKTYTRPQYIKVGDSSNFFVTTSRTNPCHLEIVTLTVSNPGLPGTFSWDLGTGTPQPGSTPVSQKVLFNDTGYQYFKVTREYNGCTTVREYFKAVYLKAPIAKFTVDNNMECDSSMAIKLHNLAVIFPQYNHTYNWKFFDNSNGKLLAVFDMDSLPSYSPNKYVTLDIQLVVRSNNGCADSLRVNAAAFWRVAKAEMVVNPEVSCVGKSIQFQSVTNTLSSTEANRYVWTLYDKDNTTVLYTENSSNNAINYAYADTGTYDAQLVAYTSKCRDTIRVQEAVRIVQPTTTFSISDTLPCVKVPVNLSATSVPDISPAVYDYAWYFENTINSTINFSAGGSNPQLSFGYPGVYNMQLTTKWGNGCTDIIQKSSKVYVSGPLVNILSSNNSDCVPLVTNVSAQLLANYNYKSINPTVNYQWSASPSAGANYANANAQNTTLTINATGQYTLIVTARNASGCSDTFYSAQPVYSGIIAGFTASKDTFCFGDTVQLTDKSQLKPDAYAWHSVPAGAQFLPSNAAASPKVVLPDSGMFTLVQVISKKNSCFDSAKHNVNAVKVVADFSSKDTVNYCAPLSVAFLNSSRNADSLSWDFGDGDVADMENCTNVSHIYFKNSGNSAFNISLKAYNNIGCSDTKTILKYIKILGPVPKFSLDVVQGCNPLKVNITDSSSSYSKYYFDFGDGSVYDTSGNPKSHTYSINNQIDDHLVFKPKLLLVDPSGCFSVFNYPVDVEVYNNPVIKYTPIPTSGCPPLTVKFFDSSKFVKRWFWDFENDGVIDDTASSPVFIYKTPGLFDVSLKVVNRYNCIAQDTADTLIHVFQGATAAFTYQKTESDTASVLYNFTNLSQNYDLVAWYIDTNFVDNLTDLTYTFLDTGLKKVTLVVTSTDGCFDTAVQYIKVDPDYFFYIPNAFTPNESGGNEDFGAVGTIWHKEFTMRIFNRWGEMVFEANDIRKRWDGTFNGRKCPQDTYHYSIIILDTNNHWYTYKGSVVLLR